jgi:O-antigen biosynthesis protein
MRIGVLYMGNESNRIWGGGVISHYLIQAFEELGHQAWRASATENGDVSELPPVDVLISEGVPNHLIRPLVRQKARRIVYWWLSQVFYDETQIAEAGFDGIATNSRAAAQRLHQRGVRVRVVDLAASPQLASACPRDEYRTRVTYVGNYPHKRQEQLDALLLPAVPFGLDIWGRGWDRSTFRDRYRGVLPLLDIGPLYRSADAVLAITEDRQRNIGMVNNRIFEAIASGAVVISEHHPFLAEHELGRFVHFSTGPDMVQDVLERLPADPSLRELAAEGQRCVLANHTYRQRAEEFVRFFEQLEH